MRFHCLTLSLLLCLVVGCSKKPAPESGEDPTKLPDRTALARVSKCSAGNPEVYLTIDEQTKGWFRVRTHQEFAIVAACAASKSPVAVTFKRIKPRPDGQTEFELVSSIAVPDEQTAK